MHDPLTKPRIAIIGAGIGELHMDGWLAQGEAVDVRVVCDLDLPRAASLAVRAPDCATSADLAAVLGDPEVDIVSNCLPPHLHAKVTLDALAAGKHVVCEKPFATSLVEAQTLVAAAQRAGKVVAPVFQYRYGRGFYRLRELKRRGLVGAPVVANIETHWDRRGDYYAVPWRGTWDGECGGALLGHAIHAHDLVCHDFDDVASVSAMTDTRVNDIETEDCAAIALRTRSGALVTSSVTLGAAMDETRIRLVFEHLTVESARVPFAPGEATWTFTARPAEQQAAVDSALTDMEAEVAARPQGFAGQFEALLAELRGEAADSVTPADAVRSIALVTALYHAARTGQRVALPLQNDHPLSAGWRP